MYKNLLLLVLMVTIFPSCANDDDVKNSQPLSGNWILTEVECFCFLDPSINFNDFSLQFEENENVVHISNPTEDLYYIAPSGSYTYEIDGSILKINGAPPFKYQISGSTLILSNLDDPEIADDELVLFYKMR